MQNSQITRADIFSIKKEKQNIVLNKISHSILTFINYITKRKYDRQIGDLYSKIVHRLYLRTIR